MKTSNYFEDEASFKVGNKVRVSSELTGDGTEPEGMISKIENFAGATFYTVNYLRQPGGTTTTNPGLLTKI